MDLRILGNAVSKRPVVTIIVILLITSIFGFYASQVQMNADMQSFLPNDEMVKAQMKVSDNFGDTDIVQIIFVSNNTLYKDRLLDMFKVEEKLENDSVVSKNLKTPDHPGESIISPADIIVMGNLTLSFESKLISMLYKSSENMKNVNFTVMLLPLKAMNSVIGDYKDIYNNATLIRKDAENIVLLLFNMPSGGNNTGFEGVEPLIQNISAVLLTNKNDDFGIKSKVLTILTPPITNESGNQSTMKNLLFEYFVDDMRSNLTLNEKGIAVHYFSLTNNFTHESLTYSISSINSTLQENSQVMDALGYVKMSLLANQNSTALYILDKLLTNIDQQQNNMSKVLPFYEEYNISVSNLLYYLNQGNFPPPTNIYNVSKAISNLSSISSGKFKNMLNIFNDTFNKWIDNPYIFYDVAYEANITLQQVRGFLNSYYALQIFKDNINYIKMEINNDTIQNTTKNLDTLISFFNETNNNLSIQKDMMEKALYALNTPYAKWFSQMINDLDYVIFNSNVGKYAINIFNYVIGLMNKSQGENGGNSFSQFTVFYSLKHAFDSPVADFYKIKIQDMYLTIMGMAKLGKGMENSPTLPTSPPSFETPNLNPPLDEKKRVLENMSQSDIESTLKNIENYNSTDLTSALNYSLPIIRNFSNNMGKVEYQLERLISNVWFVANTTSDVNVRESLLKYHNMYTNISNAHNAVKKMIEYLPHLTGFTYMMDQFSGQLKIMFSKDFNGSSAKAAMMIVMLNSTYLPGESDNEHSKRMEALEERVQTIAKEADVKSEIMVMGTYLISQATEKTSNETINVLLPVSMILVVIILLITFRSLLDTVLGLMGLGMAIGWAYGFGVMMNYNFNQISTTVAVLLVGLGIDYAIHTILRYREELRKGRKVRDAMNEMITHLGMGLILATITTIIAFLSNISSPIPPVQDFGIMNAVGIFGAFIIFTTAVPAIKIVIDEWREKRGKLKIKKEKEREGSGLIILNKFMALSAIAAEHHRYAVIGAVLLITGAAIYGGMNIGTTFDLKDFLPQNLEITHTINFMIDNFNTSGMNDNYILIEGNITSPQALEAVKDTMNNLKDDKYIDYSQSTSITTLIVEWEEKNNTFAKMVSQNDTNGDGLPDKNIIGIYNWLYKYADGKSILHKANGTYDSMIIIIRSSASTDEENRVLTSEIEKDIQPLKNVGLKAIPTGTNLLTFHILDMLEGSQWRSLMITVIASLIVLTIVFFYERRSLLLGIITSLPVILALLWLLGTMYLLGINFNVVTVTITSLTIGLGITYAIHISHRFLEDWERERNIEDAILKTVRHTGTSIFGAATTTMAAFGTLMLSSMPPIQQFGEIATLSILYSFVLSVFILPTFLYVWANWKKKSNRN